MTGRLEAVRRARAAAIARLRRARTTLLTLGGFGALTTAAWVQFGLAAGLAAVGVSAFVLEYLSGEDPQP